MLSNIDPNKIYKNKPEFDAQAYKHAISMIESSGGKNLWNNTSSATGKYQFLYNLIKDDPDMDGVSRREFMNRPKLQEKIMDKALAGKLKGYTYGSNYANRLKKDYNTNYSTGQLIALVHFLGAGNARKFLKDPENFKVKGVNVSPQKYLNLYKKHTDNYNQANKESTSLPTTPKRIYTEDDIIESQVKIDNTSVYSPRFKSIDSEMKENLRLSQQAIDDYKARQDDLNNFRKGGMLKRADGSYSRRGLWDNIRANKGSGKKPTKEMLRQERKINSKAHGGNVPQASGVNELVTLFESGGTHEENPLGGIPQGIGINGKTNLVEEGETKWNDYIFSNSIKLDGSFLDNIEKKSNNFNEGGDLMVSGKNPNKDLDKNPKNKKDPLKYNKNGFPIIHLPQREDLSEDEYEDRLEKFRIKMRLTPNQLQGFRDQRASDRDWMRRRQAFYSEQFKNWREVRDEITGRQKNKLFSKADPEYIKFWDETKNSWIENNPRVINDIVSDYAKYGPKNEPNELNTFRI